MPIPTRRSSQADIRCVKLEELLASKLKALLQRQHSPDLYDFVHAVFFQKVLNISRREVLMTFLKQTIYEPQPLIARNLLLELPFQAIRGLWSEYRSVPSARSSALKMRRPGSRLSSARYSRLLNRALPMPARRVGPRGRTYFPSPSRSNIMESARLHRLLWFMYDGLERLIEPYALVFKTPEHGVAREYLYGWDLRGGRSGEAEIKSYIADKVHSVSILDQTFEPRFPIELTKSTGYFAKSFSTSAGTFTSRRTAKKSSFGIEYTVECPYCNKRFKRSSYDTKLNEHKDRYGNRCYGRVGYIV